MDARQPPKPAHCLTGTAALRHARPRSQLPLAGRPRPESAWVPQSLANRRQNQPPSIPAMCCARPSSDLVEVPPRGPVDRQPARRTSAAGRPVVTGWWPGARGDASGGHPSPAATTSRSCLRRRGRWGSAAARCGREAGTRQAAGRPERAATGCQVCVRLRAATIRQAPARVAQPCSRSENARAGRAGQNPSRPVFPVLLPGSRGSRGKQSMTMQTAGGGGPAPSGLADVIDTKGRPARACRRHAAGRRQAQGERRAGSGGGDTAGLRRRKQAGPWNAPRAAGGNAEMATPPKPRQAAGSRQQAARTGGPQRQQGIYVYGIVPAEVELAPRCPAWGIRRA